MKLTLGVNLGLLQAAKALCDKTPGLSPGKRDVGSLISPQSNTGLLPDAGTPKAGVQSPWMLLPSGCESEEMEVHQQ